MIRNHSERDFFLLAEDQQRLLSLIMDKYRCKFILWDIRQGYKYEHRDKSGISNLDFSKFPEGNAVLLLQREDIKKEIVYENVELPEGVQKEIDFVRSGLIEFEPCILVKKRKILLMGRIAISRPLYYKETGFDKYNELKAWFNHIASDLKNFCVTNESISITEDDGTKAKWTEIYYGPEACEFSRKGGKLKQFLEGPMVFYPSGPCKKAK